MDLDAIISAQKHTIDGLRAESATPGLRTACAHVKAAFRVLGMSRIRATMGQMGYGKDGAE